MVVKHNALQSPFVSSPRRDFSGTSELKIGIADFEFTFFQDIHIRIDVKGDQKGTKREPKGAGMTGASREIEYLLLHEILHTVSET